MKLSKRRRSVVADASPYFKKQKLSAKPSKVTSKPIEASGSFKIVAEIIDDLVDHVFETCHGKY